MMGEVGQRRTLRIGLLTPSSNTCLEPTCYRLVQGRTDVSLHFARVRVVSSAMDADAAKQYSPQAMQAAADLLGDAHVDVIAWTGTSGSWLGSDYDAQIVDAIRIAAGAPATTSTIALLAALEEAGITRIGLVTPYSPKMNARIVEVFAATGIEVVATNGLAITDNDAIASIDPDVVTAQARAVAPGAQAIVLWCTNLHGAELVAPLQEELGLPVIDSVAVTLEQALSMIGIQQMPGSEAPAAC